MGEQRPVVDYDPYDPEAAKDPFPLYAHLRERCPMAHSPAHDGFWIASRYDDINEILHRTDAFSSRYSSIPKDMGFGDVLIPPLQLDPPDHNRVRRLLVSAFTPNKVAALQAVVTDRVHELIDDFIADGRCDAAQQFGRAIPTAMVCRLLDLPRDEDERFTDWVVRILENAGSNHEVAVGAGLEVMTYLGGLLYERRVAPGDDLISDLVHAEIDGERLEDGEIMLACMELLVAGIDTTWHTLSSSILHLATNPEDQRRLRNDPSMVPSAIEEFLRLYAPVTVARLVTTDVELHGQLLKAGDMVLIPFPSANRDGKQFPDPDTADLERQSNRHFAFGAGPHRCIGANLARMELVTALGIFLQRVPEFHLAESDVGWAAGLMRGPRRVLIRFPV